MRRPVDSQLYHNRALEQGIDSEGLKPGVALAIHTHGDFSNWQSHLHGLVTAGVADRNGEITPLDLPWRRIGERPETSLPGIQPPSG